ncbi:MAG: carboxylate-amine ligase [Planctomycetota bacterium]|jgi:hypothetical protein
MSDYRYSIQMFRAIGVELEYMIADARTLDVKPIADEVLRAVTGAYETDAEPDGPDGPVGWSNELALHVIELKTLQPPQQLDGLAPVFQRHVQRINGILRPLGARLMPTAMHPWMDPDRELRLWPHDCSPVYEAFDRIFSCRGHGWANLQSAHVNLPFGDDEQFGRLHAAIRLVLPLVPALAASSPVVDGRLTGLADNRLEAYRGNARRVPSVGGKVIPEPVFTRADYEGTLLAGIYRDIAPHDPDGILRHEWLNARGCIARFDRGAIEIRLLDVQECPAADLAVAALVAATVRALAERRWSDDGRQRAWPVEPLHELLLRTIRDGEAALVDNDRFLAIFGRPEHPCSAGELWAALAEELLPAGAEAWPALHVLLGRGTLARRITRALGASPDRDRLRAVYGALCDCLEEGRMFDGAAGGSRP